MAIARKTGIDLALVIILEQYLHLSVAINIGTAGIVGDKRRGDGFVMLGRYFKKILAPCGSGSTHGLLDTTFYGLYGIATGCCASSIRIVRHVQPFGHE